MQVDSLPRPLEVALHMLPPEPKKGAQANVQASIGFLQNKFLNED